MRLLTLPPLPPGFLPAPPPQRPEPPAPVTAPAPGPLMSGPITTVTTPAGTEATIHRADYTITDHRGGYVQHGYGWRCTACTRTGSGYPPVGGFTAARTDARTHVCEELR